MAARLVRAAAAAVAVAVWAAGLVAQAEGAMMVVGFVDSSSARVLLDALTPSERGAYTATTECDGVQVATEQVTLGEGPEVFVIGGLSGQKVCEVRVVGPAGPEPGVTFSPASHSEFDAVVMSCDRFVDDHDPGMWDRIHDDPRSQNVVMHIGDQIYGDILKGPARQGASYHDLLHGFRQLYRETWGRPEAQRVLRRGSHWFLPDDHDVVNNHDSRTAGEDDGVFAELVRAGIDAEMEYQHRLMQPQARLTYTRFIERGPVGVVLLDVRVGRSLHPDPEHPWVTFDDEAELRDKLEVWQADQSITDVVIVAQVPFVFINKQFAELAEWAEAEHYPAHPAIEPQAERLLDVIATCAKAQLLVGGDNHQFSAIDVHRSGAGRRAPRFLQIISSGITFGSASVQSSTLLWFFGGIRFFTTPRVGHWTGSFLTQWLGNNYLALSSSPLGGPDVDTAGSVGNLHWAGVYRPLPAKYTLFHMAYDWGWWIGVSALVQTVIWIGAALHCLVRVCAKRVPKAKAKSS